MDWVKVSIYLAILSLIVGALSATSKFIYDSGYDSAMLEVAEQIDAKDGKVLDKIKAMNIALNADPEPPVTVTEIVEKIKYVTKIVEKEVFVCDDLGDNYIRVRNDIRRCIFSSPNNGAECIHPEPGTVQN